MQIYGHLIQFETRKIDDHFILQQPRQIYSHITQLQTSQIYDHFILLLTSYQIRGHFIPLKTKQIYDYYLILLHIKQIFATLNNVKEFSLSFRLFYKSNLTQKFPFKQPYFSFLKTKFSVCFFFFTNICLQSVVNSWSFHEQVIKLHMG